MAIAETGIGSCESNDREWTVVAFTAADEAARILRGCIRINAEDLIAWILHQEFERFLLQHRIANEAPNVVRNGFQPARTIMTGLGMLTVRYPKARSKNGMSVSFRSQLVPRYAHRAQERSDAAEWKCLDAVRNENLAGILRAAFGDRADHVTHVVPELAAKWAARVKVWKDRSLAEHHDQDLWVLTISPPNGPESQELPLNVAIAVGEGGAKRILCIAKGDADSPASVLRSLVESIQDRGLMCPRRIFSNWQAVPLSDGLRRLAPQWAARVIAQESNRMERPVDSTLIGGWDWPVAIHQN